MKKLGLAALVVIGLAVAGVTAHATSGAHGAADCFLCSLAEYCPFW